MKVDCRLLNYVCREYEHIGFYDVISIPHTPAVLSSSPGSSERYPRYTAAQHSDSIFQNFAPLEHQQKCTARTTFLKPDTLLC